MDNIENYASNSCFIVACIFVVAVTFITSHCLAMIGGYTYRHMMVEIVKYAVEMGSGAMMYIQSFMKIGSGIQKLIVGDTYAAWCSHKPTFIFSKYGK
jgi:hypothetical protein